MIFYRNTSYIVLYIYDKILWCIANETVVDDDHLSGVDMITIDIDVEIKSITEFDRTI